MTTERLTTSEDDDRPTASDDSKDLAALVALVKRGASGNFAVKVAGAALAFAVHLAIARSIGVADYGIYALVLSWISVLAVIAQFGQDSSILHFLPTYAVRREWALLKGLRRGSNLLVLGLSSLISSVGLIYVHWLLSSRPVALVRTFDIGLLLLPVLTLLQQSGALHRALKQAAESELYVSIVRPLALLFLVIVLHFATPALLSAPLVLFLSLTSAVVALAVSSFRLRVHWPKKALVISPHYKMSQWIKVGAQLSLLSVMMVASTTMGSLVIGGFRGATSVGPYYAAVQLALFSSFGFTAINTILAPMIAEYYAAGRHDLLARLMHRAAWMTFLSTSLLAGLLAICGRYVLRLFGPGFAIAYVPLLILLVGEWLNTCAGSVGFLLTMTRFQKQAPGIFLCGVVSSLVFAIIAVPAWGLTGMALATVVGWVVWNAVALTFVHRKLGINPTIFHYGSRRSPR